MTTKRETKLRRGSQNIFADPGFADPSAHLLKAELMARIQDILDQRDLTQTKAARILGVSQPDISRMLKGHFRDISVERLMRMLTKLGCSVEIVVKARGRRKAAFAPIQIEAA